MENQGCTNLSYSTKYVKCAMSHSQRLADLGGAHGQYLHKINNLYYTTQNLLRITFSTVCYFCVFVINMNIDFRE